MKDFNFFGEVMVRTINTLAAIWAAGMRLQKQMLRWSETIFGLYGMGLKGHSDKGHGGAVPLQEK